jgi:RHS repeat-associated protein
MSHTRLSLNCLLTSFFDHVRRVTVLALFSSIPLITTVESSAQSSQPTISWNVDVDGFWDVASNWRDNAGNSRVPNPGDDVLVDRGSVRPTITIRTAPSVHSISGSAPVVVTSTGSFTIAVASQLTGGISLSGTLNLNGPLTIAGNSTWQSGTIVSNSAGLTNTGTLILSGADTKVLGSTLSNTGTIVHEGGALGLGDFIAFTGSFFGALNNSGLYDVQADVTLQRSPSAFGAITNSGTFRKSAGTGTTGILGMPFNNNGGTIDAESGTIMLTGGTHNGGTFSAGLSGNAASMVQFTGMHTFTGAFSGSGNGVVQLNGTGTGFGSGFVAGSGGASLNFSPGLLQWASGLIDGGTGGWLNKGTLTVAQAATTILIKNRFDNAGTLVISGVSAMDIDTCTGNFTNLPGAILDFEGDGGLFDFNAPACGPHSLLNNGTIRKSIGTLSNIDASGFNNTSAGTIDVRAGTLVLGSGNSTGGTFSVAQGATIDLTGGNSVTYSGPYTGSGAGNVLLASGTLVTGSSGASFNFPPGQLIWTGGLITGAPAGLTNTGTLTLAGSGSKLLGGVLNNAGTIVHQAGTLQVNYADSSSALAGTVNNSGVYDVQADVTLRSGFLGAGIINNTGTFRKSAGTGTTTVTFGLPLNNTGAVEARSGSILMYSPPQLSGNTLTGATLTGGTWHVFSNSTLNFSDPMARSVPVLISLNQATVILDGPSATFPPISALNSNAGSLSLLNGSTFTTSGSLSNSGTIVLGAGTKLNVTGTYTNTAAASLTTQIAGRPSTGQFGQLSSSGTATLGGSLNATFGAGFGVTAGDVYTVMTFPSRTGSFGTVAVGASLRADLNATALILTAQATQSDLSTSTVTIVSPTAQPGQQVTVTFSVQNLGGPTTIGGWDDSVYISPSPFVEPNSVLLGTVRHTGDVAGQASYTGTLTGALPALLPGSYKVLVVADSGNVVPDANRANNTGVSTGTMAVSIPLLSLGTPLTGTIANGQDLYYHLVLPPGADVTLSATYAAGNEAELYVRFAALPTRTSFDLSTLGDLSNQNPKLAENNTQGGDYYLLLHGLTAAGAGQPFTLLSKAAEFQITSISPDAVLLGGIQTIFLGGTEFTPQTTVSLIAMSGTAYPAVSLSFMDSTSLSATFDFGQIPLGSYTVRATAGQQTATASEVFFVVNNLVGTYASEVIMSPAKVRVGQPIPVSVTIRGIGDAITPVPLVQIDATNVAMGEEHQQLADPTLPLFFIGEQGFGVLYHPEPRQAGVESDFNLGLASLAEGIDWDGQKDSLRPRSIPADAWDAIWANLRPRVRSTVGDFYSLLGLDAGALAANGITTNRLNRLFQFEIQMANDQSPVAVTRSAVDIAFPAPGLTLQFARTFLGSSIAGRYRLGRLGRGWVDALDISAAVDTATQNVTIQQGVLNRLFSRNPDGTYNAQPGDSGKLTQSGGIFQLREKTGLLTAFRADGSLDYIQDINNNRLTAGYTGTQLTSVTNSNASAITLSYNAQGRIQQVTDPAGRTAIYTYDPSGQQLTSVTTAAGTVSYTYTAETSGPRAFALASVSTPAGTHAFYEYDPQGRPQKTQRDGGAETVTYSYATGGVRMTDADGRVTDMGFDDSGRIVRTVDALDHQQTAEFDDNSNLTAVTPDGGGTTSFTYDSKNNLTGSSDPLGSQERLAYDPVFNHLTLATDALGHITSFNLDANGNTVSANYVNGSRDQYSYDGQGDLTRSVDRNGKPTDFTIDKSGLVTSAQFGDGSHTDYTYDAHANLISATNAQGTISMQYDLADRLTRIGYPNGRFLAYSYNSGGQLIQANDQTGFVVNYLYDQAGRLTSLTDASGASSYTYDAAGLITRLAHGNGTATTFEYDSDGRLIHLVHYSPSNTVNSRFDYTYDILGRPDTVTTVDGKTTYTYDADSRLTSVTLPNSRVITYVYDAAGNRIGTTDNGLPTTYTVNNLDEYLTIGATSESYDSAGNLLGTSGNVGSSYTYDPQNRLIGVSGTAGAFSYEYDALGHRNAVVSNGKRTEFVIDPAGNAVGQYDASGQVVAHYTYGLALTSRVDAGGAAYYDFDATGSVAGLTASVGQYVDRYSYLPFGELLSIAENVANPFHYIGAFGVQDDQNGLNFMRARYYNSAQGRFTQPDPIGLGGGTNAYAYAENSPLDESDPSGLFPVGLIISPLATTLSPLATTIPGEALAATIPDAALAPTMLAPRVLDPLRIAQGPWNPEFQAAVQTALRRAALHNAARAARSAGVYGAVLIGGAIIAQNLSAAYIYHEIGDLPPCLPFLPKVVQTCSGTVSIAELLAAIARTLQVTSGDPNYISGPGGFGPNNLIAANTTLPYIIGFQNEPNATAPAQEVVITQPLDPNLDLSTFQLGDFGFGSFNVHVPDGRQSYSTRIDASSSAGVLVDVAAALTGNVVTWTFRSIDPATQQPPTDPGVGFLPPDQVPPNGEGYVTYFARPASGRIPGTQIKAQAGVVFDTNGSVATNLYINTIAPSTVQCTGAYFLISGVRATFAFNVNAIAGTGSFTYNYRTATQTVQFSAATISQISVNNSTVTFGGQGSLNGKAGYNFQVTATDGGGPGSGLDAVGITITGPNSYSYSAGGTIVGGDIVIKP